MSKRILELALELDAGSSDRSAGVDDIWKIRYKGKVRSEINRSAGIAIEKMTDLLYK